jgi:hypothetical protein
MSCPLVGRVEPASWLSPAVIVLLPGRNCPLWSSRRIRTMTTAQHDIDRIACRLSSGRYRRIPSCRSCGVHCTRSAGIVVNFESCIECFRSMYTCSSCRWFQPALEARSRLSRPWHLWARGPGLRSGPPVAPAAPVAPVAPVSPFARACSRRGAVSGYVPSSLLESRCNSCRCMRTASFSSVRGRVAPRALHCHHRSRQSLRSVAHKALVTCRPVGLGVLAGL